MLLDCSTAGISKALYMHGERELDMVEVVKELCVGAEAILDLGANIGYYSLLMRRESSSAFILAIEPDPRNFHLLTLNMGSYNNVQCLNVAAGLEDGTAPMVVSEKSNLNTLVSSELNDDVSTKIVKVMSFDTLLEYFPNQKFDFLRMDIEGFEYEIFLALIDAIDKFQFKPKILFEVHTPLYNKKNRNMGVVLEKFCNKYKYKIETLITSGEGLKYFSTKNMRYEKKIRSDGFERYVYKNVSLNTACESLMHEEKVVRYLLISPL